MATVVLGAVGALVSGPLGAAVGAMVGQQIDNRLFAPKGRQGPRLGDLAVQTSSYGSAIPKIFGTMRVAGTVIWATDLKEDRDRQGGGKGKPSTTTYTYSASFAVAVSGRAIARVGRIWADGKLLRGAAGDFKSATRFRLYRGGENQMRDPLIAAAEGLQDTPAFRGIAYVVFEDFQLGDYGNRIPSLTFEVIGDEGGTGTGAIADSLSGGAIAGGAGTALTGFAAYGDSVRSVVAVIGDAVPTPLYDDGERLRLGVSGEPATIAPALAAGQSEATRVAAGQVPGAVAIGYYDPARDYQAGLQRADYPDGTGGARRRMEQIALPAAVDAGAARALAAAKLDHHWRTRERRALSLPWSEMSIRPGQLVKLAPSEKVWLVIGWTLERMAVRIELVAHAGAAAAVLPAVAGRAVIENDFLHGRTTIHLFDAPALGDGIEVSPRMLVAAAGEERGWRNAVLEASGDGGASWHAAGATAPAAVIGTALDVLPPGSSTLFDAVGSVEVALLNEEMWLESRDDDALVAGGNMAMIGDELIQFGRAEPMGGGRFRLSRLLRGRRGSEWAATTHAAGDRFVLIEAGTLVAVPVSLANLGGVARVSARGIGDGDEPALAAQPAGTEAVRPPSPVHLRSTREADGGSRIAWTRRSRAGWAWIDGSDAPVGEASEAYRVTFAGGARERVVEVGSPEFVYQAEMRAEDGAAPGTVLTVDVVQVGTLATSRPARMTITV